VSGFPRIPFRGLPPLALTAASALPVVYLCLDWSLAVELRRARETQETRPSGPVVF